MAVDLTKALFQSRTRAALLKAVLRDGVSDSLSGLARRTGRSQHAVAVEVRNLAAAGLVNVESVGGADVVRANRAHPAVGPIVQLLAAADAVQPGNDVPDLEVKESLAYYGAPLAARDPRQHLKLEATLVRALAVAKRDPAVLRSLLVVLVKHRNRLDWPVIKEEARRLKLKSELGMVVELAADASGHTELKARVADLRDHRRKTDVFFAEPRDDHDRGVVVRASPPAARKWGFFVNVGEDSLRVALRKSLPRPARPRSARPSLAAAKADAAERGRIRRMSVVDRALLALDLGERLNVFARPRA
jgi:hypothetical protein